MPREVFRREVEKELTGRERGAVGTDLLQSLQEPDPRHRAGNRDGGANAGHGQIARLLSGDDLRRLPRRRAPGQWQPGNPAQLDLTLLQVCPANSSRLSSKACVTGRPENDSLRTPSPGHPPPRCITRSAPIAESRTIFQGTAIAKYFPSNGDQFTFVIACLACPGPISQPDPEIWGVGPPSSSTAQLVPRI